MAYENYVKASKIGVLGGTVAGVLGSIFIKVYDKYYPHHNSKFAQDFIAQGNEFNRTLTPTEKLWLSKLFPKADVDKITFLGIGSIRPSDENCSRYECKPGTAYIYDTKSVFKGAMTAMPGQVSIMQAIWDQCNSGLYKCVYTGHPPIGATYNCIGHALGISKWLDPSEITAYNQGGMTRHEAIETFIKDKKAIYHAIHESNIDHIIDKLHPTQSFTHNPLHEHSVAFFFNGTSGDCTHGARYLEKFHGKDIGSKWTSKLGNAMTIGHELNDLIDGVYGNETYYAEII